jgi:plastocyanin
MTFVLIAIIIVLLTSSIPSKLTLPNRGVIASPTTAHHTFWLLGSIMGWNQTRPGPLVTVTDGDFVTIMYSSVDSAPHTWFIDVNSNNMPDPGEISSPTIVASAAPFVNFTFTLTVGTNIPSTGDFTYRCSYHPTMMFGTFRVQAPVVMPDFKIAMSSSTLTVAQGASRNVVVTLTSISGFSGIVSLTYSLSSSGPQVTFSPTSLAVPSGGSINSTLGVSAASSGTYSTPVSQGSYTITVTATSGSLVHTSTLSLTVGSPSGVGDLTGSAIIIGGVGAGIVVAAAAVYALRRRTRTTT